MARPRTPESSATNVDAGAGAQSGGDAVRRFETNRLVSVAEAREAESDEKSREKEGGENNGAEGEVSIGRCACPVGLASRTSCFRA